MKKVISLMLITVVFLLQSIVVYGLDEINVDGITYGRNGNELIIKGVDSSLKVLNIKKKLNVNGTECFVQSIEFGALRESDVEEINLPEEGIDINSFDFRNLYSLCVVKNLDKANIISSKYLFSGCCNLRCVNLPEKLEVIGEDMFDGCTALENIKIPKNVRKIGVDSFFGCCKLNRVDIEEGRNLENIEKGAFAGCKNLEYINVPKDIDIAQYAFFDCDKLNLNCDIPMSARTYDKSLEDKAKQAELFAKKILDCEGNGNKLVTVTDIDRLLYKYTPKSTDPPTVVSKEKFDQITSDGRLVLYRGDLPCLNKNGQEITIKEINDAFKYGDYYYPSECNGIFCTKYAEHAKTYAVDYQSKIMTGSVTQFCFTDTSPDELKVITSSELKKIEEFYKYSHIENYLRFMRDWGLSGRFRLKNGLLNLGVDTMNFSFLARALGYDLIDNECDGMGGDGCSKDTPTSQFEVLNRGKLTVCRENIF